MKNNSNKSILFYILLAFVSLGLLYYLVNIKKVEVEDSFTVKIDEGVIDEQNINKEMIENIINKARKKNLSKVRPIDQTDHVIGSSDAKIELIVYEDFECPFCVDYAKTIKKVIEEYSEKIKIAVRHFPLSTHNSATIASLASECAAEQGSFWEMYDKLYDDNRDLKLNSEEYLNDADEIGLDMEKFKVCLDEEKYLSKITAQVEEAKEYGVLGTPANFLNGKSFPGAFPLNDFEDHNKVKQKGLRSLIKDEITRVES